MPKANEFAFRQGPLALTRRKDAEAWMVTGTIDGKRIRVSSKTDDLHRAKRFLLDVLADSEGGWRAGADRSWEAIARLITARHRLSSKPRGIPFSIDAKLVFRLMAENSFRCAVSGLAFSKGKAVDSGRDPWGPSIDRIENRAGYLPDNVRVTCLAANIAMSNWGYDTLLRLSLGVARCAGSIVPEPPAFETPSIHTKPPVSAND